MDAFEVGCTVEVVDGKYEGATGVFVGLAKGWATVEFEDEQDDGATEGKFRLASLQVVAGEDEAGELEDAADDSELDEGDDEAGGSNLAIQMRKYRERYVPATNASGTKTKTCGDELAARLLALTPPQVAGVADALFGQPIGTHAARYASLNPGQVRMNSGNKIRAAVRKAEQALLDANALPEAERMVAADAYNAFVAALDAALIAGARVPA